jgi:alkylation response protein AidB-like acyl-CoA dehydrogenase
LTDLTDRKENDVTASSHYRSNLRDLFFNLFEFHDVGTRTLGRGPFQCLDATTARETLVQLEKLAQNELAASFAAADQQGVALDSDGNVKLPKELRASLDAYHDRDYHLFEMPESLGGMNAPPSLNWAGYELLAGSNAAAGFYLTTQFMLRIIDRLATPEQRARFLPAALDRRWNCTMVLTEPDAGSDVGAGKAKARHVEGDEWHIEGVKRFITGGDNDYFENIIHLVLARPEGAAPGTKGLSLFLIPKIWVEKDSSLGERNGVRTTKVEHKMGLRASATCELVFGDEKPARGLLLGNVHDGIRQMFNVIEQARMAIGVKSMSTMSTAYLNALAFAQERIQGPNLLRVMDKSSPRVPIMEHPDVRRMLLVQKCHAEGMRALCFYAASLQDEREIMHVADHKAAQLFDRRNDLLLPLIKGYCSEKVYELLAVSLQCFGGSGYLADYPIEQYIRDQKIDSLYEGTTHIQALDLLLRKVGRDGGQTLRELLAEAQATLSEQAGGADLSDARTALQEALEHVQAMLMALLGKMGESLYHVGLQGNRVLMALAEVLIAWLLIRHAALAQTKLAALPDGADSERAFYQGKIFSARYFATQVLPRIAVERRQVEQSDLAPMTLPDACF